MKAGYRISNVSSPEYNRNKLSQDFKMDIKGSAKKCVY